MVYDKYLYFFFPFFRLTGWLVSGVHDSYGVTWVLSHVDAIKPIKKKYSTSVVHVYTLR